MYTSNLKILMLAAIAVISAMLLNSAFADNFAQHKIVNGMAIYLGVMPSEMILGHTKARTETEMHGGTPVDSNVFHITFSLFDVKTGERITGAKVKARVAGLGMTGTEKNMEPMLIAGTVSYGNYFKISGTDVYRIRLQIRMPGVAQTIEAEFDYQPARI